MIRFGGEIQKMKKNLFYILLVGLCLVGFADDPPVPLFNGLSFQKAITNLHKTAIVSTVEVNQPFESTTNISASASGVVLTNTGQPITVYLQNINDSSKTIQLGYCVIPEKKTVSNPKSADVFKFPANMPFGIYNVMVGATHPFDNNVSIDVSGSVSVAHCPNRSDCYIEECGTCHSDICILHQVHHTRCFQCVHRNVHCHCSNSSELLDAWETAARQTTLCQTCGAQICGLCTHMCYDIVCPETPTCVMHTCSVCGSEYCKTHVFHLCSNYTEYHDNNTGIISSQTSIHGSADVTVNIDASGVESALNSIDEKLPWLGIKMDFANENLNNILSGVNQFHSDYQLGANTINNNITAGNQKLDGIGAGIGDLNTGIGDLNTGVGDLNTGITGLGEGIETLNTELADAGDSLDTQTGLLSDIKDSLQGGSSVSPGVITGGDFDLPAVGDGYEYETDLTFFEAIREKIAFPPGYFSIGSSDFTLDFPLQFLGYDFSFSLDFNDSRINPVRSVIRAISSFVMVLVFSLSVIKTLSLW